MQKSKSIGFLLWAQYYSVEQLVDWIQASWKTHVKVKHHVANRKGWQQALIGILV
jgi:hypothetical protein